jgi:hypothetical protein
MSRGPSARLDIEEENVGAKKLIALVVLLIALSLGHDFDHIARAIFAGN